MFTADLVFDRPVYVEGFDDPIMALRNTELVDLGPVIAGEVAVFNAGLLGVDQ